MNQLIEKYAAIATAQRMAIIAGLVLLQIGAYLYVVRSGVEEQRVSLRAQIEEKSQQRDEKRAIAENRAEFQARIGDLRRQLDVARAKLPDSADVPQLLAQLSNAGRGSGLSIREFTPLARANHGFYASISFDVRAEGSYHDVATFMDEVGRMERIINVTNLALTAGGQSGAKMNLNAAFQVHTFQFVEGSEGGEGTTAALPKPATPPPPETPAGDGGGMLGR
jgi:type IV pilus assembly protein PilO